MRKSDSKLCRFVLKVTHCSVSSGCIFFTL